MKQLIIKSNFSLESSLRLMKKSGEKCLVVSNNKNKLLGTVSDGDIRNALLKGYKISERIDKIYNKNPIFFYKKNINKNKIKNFFLNNKIDVIPVVDSFKKITDIILSKNLFLDELKRKYSKINAPVLIMAGGKGSRLQPLTSVLPKALVPIKGKSIIVEIIERFLKYEIKDFYISTNYKTEIIKSFFKGIKKNYKIKFIEEKKPLGTAGCLRFLYPKIKKDLIVSNCDILLDIDYNDFIKFHRSNKFDLSLVASNKSYTIPYGICELSKAGSFNQINEKPSYSFLVNTGFYLINKKILKLIPKEKFFDMNTLIEKVKKNDLKIGVFPISDEDWSDVGQLTDYIKFKNIFNEKD